MSKEYLLVSDPAYYQGDPSQGQFELAADQWVKSGQTDFDTGTGFWLGVTSDGTPKFSIGNSAGNKMTWNGTALSITGVITATSGTIGGWTIGSTTITGGSVTLDSAGNIRAGQTAYATGTGFWLGVDSSTPKFSVGSATKSLSWNGTNLTIDGTITITGGTQLQGGGSFTLSGSELSLNATGVNGITLDANHGSGNISLQAGASGTIIANRQFITNIGIVPDANDGAYLGTTTLAFSDLFLAEGGVINWDNGDATLTQAGDVLTLAGASFTVEVDRAIRFNNQTSSAGAGAGTLGNAPAAGDPGYWLKINIGGTNYAIPCWAG